MANYTSVIASNICDAAGNKLASGTVSFQATDAANQPLNFQVGGGGQVVTTPATAAITAGVIAGGFQVADSANTSPAGILYRITVTDTALNRIVAAYSLVTVTGTVFSLDTFVPTGASVLPPTGGSVNGPLTVTGNLSVTGSFTPGSIGNATFTGIVLAKNIEGVRYADQFANIQAAVTDAGTLGTVVIPSTYAGVDTYTNPNNISIVDLRPVVITSSELQNAFYLRRTDNSVAATRGGEPLNNYIAPMVRYDLLSSGTQPRSGSNQVLLLNFPSAYGKNYSNLTQAVTLNVSPQSVSVNDSSWVLPGDTLVFGLGTSNSEIVTVTAVADSTHISGIFTKNHSNNEIIHPTTFFGYKSAFGVSISELPGSTCDMDCINTGLNVSNQSAAQAVGIEADITNLTGVRPAAFYGEDNIHRYIGGQSILMFAGNGTDGFVVGSGDGTAGFNNGIISQAHNFGFVVNNGGSASMNATYGFSVQNAVTAGFIVGSNQPAAQGPNALTDPTDGLYLTARGSSGSVNSNTIAFESLISSVAHKGRLQLLGNQLIYTYDGVWNGTALDNDGGITVGATGSGAAFRLRDSGSAIRASISITGAAATLQPHVGGTLAVVATTTTIGGGTTLARYARYTPTISPAAVAANTTAEQTFTGVLTSGDFVVGVSKPTAQAGLGIVGWRASGTSLLITFSNNTAGSITPTASEVYQVTAVQ